MYYVIYPLHSKYSAAQTFEFLRNSEGAKVCGVKIKIGASVAGVSVANTKCGIFIL